MSAARVTNKTEVPLLVGGISIPPGHTVKIPNWHQHAQSDNVAVWTVAKAISVEVIGEAAAPAAEKEPPAKKTEPKSGVQSPDRG